MNTSWCKWQLKFREDTPETWTCSAHGNERRAFECPYENMNDAKNRKYPCQEAEAKEIDDEWIL